MITISIFFSNKSYYYVLELKQQLDKKEKTVAFFRLELLEEKDSAKKERATLKSEIDHLKRQNVVNANRVVILEVCKLIFPILIENFALIQICNRMNCAVFVKAGMKKTLQK